MATANLHHCAPANLDHPLYPIYFIRSCTSPRPVTPGDAISAATRSVPPQHNLLFVTREYRESSGAALDLENDGVLQVFIKRSR